MRTAQQSPPRPIGAVMRVAAFAMLALCVGCASFPRLSTSAVAPIARRAEQPVAPAGDRKAGRLQTNVDVLADKAPVGVTPPAPRFAAPTEEEIAALFPERLVQVTAPPQPLPQFIDTMFGQILQTAFFTGPGIAERRDIISLRGSATMSNRKIFDLVRTALAQYGIDVGIENGAVRIAESEALFRSAPLFIRSRTMPEAPDSSRPVVQFFELKAVDVGSLMSMLEEVYPNRGNVTFTPREEANTLVVSGGARDVASAAAMIDAIDQPRFAGGQIARVEPAYWSAERLAEAITQVLTTEGYKVAQGNEGPPRPLVFLPIPFTNQILLFANDPQLFTRALYWVAEMDKPSALGDQQSVFVYTVRNTSAAELGALVSQVTPESGARQTSGGQRLARAALPRPSQTGQEGASPGQGAGNAARITVDAGGNRLIFRGTPSEYERARELMEQLDSPPHQVLVELTIAEVTLTDETRFGVDWFLRESIGSAALTLDTRGGSVREPGGLGATYSRVFSRGAVEAALNAIAENRNLNILSTPRLVARSGSEAQILIGTDVPIITSQRAANNQTGGDTDILQTVQYRQTGVILNMRPVVYGDDRVDIEIYQEVSSQEPNRTSSISSPIILNRSVTTQLSLREGMTAVIGGLIQDNYSREQRGVPLLKDVPLVGSAFRSDSVAGTKVELLILVTPYIVRNDEEMNAAASRYSGAINRTLRLRGARVHTLLPWRLPGQAIRAHGGVNVLAPQSPAPDASPEADTPAPAIPEAARPAKS